MTDANFDLYLKYESAKNILKEKERRIMTLLLGDCFLRLFGDAYFATPSGIHKSLTAGLPAVGVKFTV